MSETPPSFIAQARAAREADINALADMTEDQLTYLSMVDYLDDPVTDELECDSEYRMGLH